MRSTRMKALGSWGRLLLLTVLLVILGAIANVPSPSGAKVQNSTSAFGQDTDAPADNASHTAEEGSWPMSGANPQRTSWTPEEVRGQMYPLWAVSIEPFIPFANQVVAAYDTLYISTAKGLYALDAETGTLRWVFPTDMPLGNSPTIYDGVAYVGGYDHRLYALDAISGELLWSYVAGGGFATNPLVVEGKVIVGNRDGTLYAVNTDGTLAWKFETEGSILFSAAYKDGAVYFASNDSHGYAVYSDGTLKWKSAKLPGGGFYTYWPVIYSHSGHDYVVLGGSNDYRMCSELSMGGLGPLDRDALYHNTPAGELVGLTGTEPGDWVPGTITIDDTRAVQYLEAQPHRRRVFILDSDNGHEYTFDSDADGDPEYAPITWFGTNGGSRYPSVIGSDGVLYTGNSYISDIYVPLGGPAGWKFGSQYISRVHEGSYGAVAEPISISAGGNLIYWGWFSGGAGMGAYDITLPFGADNRGQIYWAGGEPYYLIDSCPGAGAMYGQGVSIFNPYDYFTSGTIYGIYMWGGDQNPPIPYKGKLYFHILNTVFALSGTSSSCHCTSLPASIADSAHLPITVDTLKQKLNLEIQKIIDAGHLRPGYYHGTLATCNFEEMVNSYMIDYFHNPAETFVTLIDALPHLSPDLQAQVRSYLQNEWAEYGDKVHIGWRDGAAREIFDTPPETQARMSDFGPMTELYGWTWKYRYSLYGRWKYIQEFDDQDHTLAIQVFDEVRGSLQIKPPEQEATWTETTVYNPYIKNAYIAGYLGYIGIGKLAGYSETGPELSPYVAELNRLMAERAAEFSTDQPTPIADANVVTLARNFMYLTPELAGCLRGHAYRKVQEALNEYYRVGPYWFVSKYNATSGEGVLQPLYDYSALFQAKALILQEPFEELVKFLDIPAFERGDLFYIQNLIASIEAPSYLVKTASPVSGVQGATITYTLSLFGNGSTLTLTDTLPSGLSAPLAFELEGTSVVPTYQADKHRLVWSDAPTPGQKVTIRYSVIISTYDSQRLANSAELRWLDGGLGTATAAILANPFRRHLPLIVKGRRGS